MRDLPASLDLLALARDLLLGELAPLLPPERRRDAHLIATAIAIAARETNEAGWQEDIERLLSDFYGEGVEASGGGLGWRGDAKSTEMPRRFAADLRNGAFETSPSRAAAARAILWRLTIEKLREGNPNFLAANGFRGAGRQDT